MCWPWRFRLCVFALLRDRNFVSFARSSCSLVLWKSLWEDECVAWEIHKKSRRKIDISKNMFYRYLALLMCSVTGPCLQMLTVLETMWEPCFFFFFLFWHRPGFGHDIYNLTKELGDQFNSSTAGSFQLPALSTWVEHFAPKWAWNRKKLIPAERFGAIYSMCNF